MPGSVVALALTVHAYAEALAVRASMAEERGVRLSVFALERSGQRFD